MAAPLPDDDMDYATMPAPIPAAATTVTVTPSNVIAFPHKPDSQPYAQAARARARARVTVTERIGKIGAGLRSVRARSVAKAKAFNDRRDVKQATPGRTVWSDPAESLAEHAAYIRAGAWSDTPLFVVFGKAYGWLAFVVCAAALGGVWVLRRPSRLFVAAAVAAVVHFTI